MRFELAPTLRAVKPLRWVWTLAVCAALPIAGAQTFMEAELTKWSTHIRNAGMQPQ
ncbi:MAG: hypothetical protein ABIR55_02565 [Burkholderiaceae bacterium]